MTYPTKKLVLCRATLPLFARILCHWLSHNPTQLVPVQHLSYPLFTTSLYSKRQTVQREIIEISQNVLAVKKLPSSTTNPCNTR